MGLRNAEEPDNGKLGKNKQFGNFERGGKRKEDVKMAERVVVGGSSYHVQWAH